MKQLISPAFRIRIGSYIITRGVEVESYSSGEAHSDWCNVTLTEDLIHKIRFADLERARVELGYGNDYDVLLDGYARQLRRDYWKEIIIKDDMIRLERIRLKATLLDVTPQDVIRYVLARAGISAYQLDSTDYGKQRLCSLANVTGVEAIRQINAMWGIELDFYVRDGMFYWLSNRIQDYVYLLEEGSTILGLNPVGQLWRAETIGIPWLHQGEKVKIYHQKISGMFRIEKVIIRSDEKGCVTQLIYFKGV